MAKQVVFVAGNDPLRGMGGHSCYVRSHARAAIRLGFEPHLFCAAPESGVAETDFGFIHRTASPFRPFRHLMVPAHGPLLARSVERFLASAKSPCFIHSIAVWGYVGAVVSRRLRRRGIDAVSVVTAYDTLVNESRAKLRGVAEDHGYLERLAQAWELLWNSTAVRHYERRSYCEARALLVNYRSVERLVTATYGNGLHLRKVTYASETAFLREGREVPEMPKTVAALRSSGAPLIATVSRHDPRKGIDVLLHALARLKGEGVAFRACLAGGGRLLEAHRQLVRTLGLSDVVVVEGFVPDSYAYTRHADVFVLPSLGEGSGSLSLLEALQAGAGIVASKVDGISEDVVDDESALLVPPGDEQALAAAIRRMLTGRGLRQRLAWHARRVFEQRFSAKAFTDALGEVYAQFGILP